MSSSHETDPYVQVAVVQAGSVLFDTPRTLEKLASLTAQAKQAGAQVVLFPEAFVGGYPGGSCSASAWGNGLRKGGRSSGSISKGPSRSRDQSLTSCPRSPAKTGSISSRELIERPAGRFTARSCSSAPAARLPGKASQADADRALNESSGDAGTVRRSMSSRRSTAGSAP